MPARCLRPSHGGSFRPVFLPQNLDKGIPFRYNIDESVKIRERIMKGVIHMKKLSVILLFSVLTLLLAVSAAAGTVMYEGGGSEEFFKNGASGALVLELNFPEPYNLDEADYLYIRYYIEDPEAYANNGQIEITSSGTCDAQEYNWDLGTMDMEPGWNEWQVDIFSGRETGGMPDFEKINYFRIYFFTDGENLVALDYVGFGGENEDFSSLATELGEVQRQEHVAKDEVKRTGEGDVGAISLQAAMELTPVNTEETDYAYIRLFLDGVEHFTGNGQLELTSKLNPDQQEIHWDVTGLDLQDGWNELKLDMDLPDSFDAEFNRAAVNFFRLYMFTEGPLSMELDYVGFGGENDSFGTDLPLYLVIPKDLEPQEEEEAAEVPAEETAEEPAEEPAEPAEEPAGEAAPEPEAAVEEVAEEPQVEEPVLAPATAPDPKPSPNTFDASFFIALFAVSALLGVTFTRRKS